MGKRLNPKKTPFVMQLEDCECGAACLNMILAYYGKFLPLEQLRKDCGVSRDGSTVKNILRAARSYGLKAKAYSTNIEGIKKSVKFPCIIHWYFSHFIVLKGFSRKYALINDPAGGSIRIPMEEFERGYTGICLQFDTTDDFVPGGQKTSPVKYFFERVKGVRVAMLFVVVTTVLTCVFSVIQPALTGAFYDKIMDGPYRLWLIPFICFFGIVALIQVLLSIINIKYLKKINGKTDAVGCSGFMWKLLKLPIDFFSQRSSGDLLSRKNINVNISTILVETVAPLFLEGILMVVYLVVMIRYNLLMAIIGTVSVIVSIFISRIISKKRLNLTYASIRERSRLEAAAVNGIRLMESIKASGSENGYFNQWAGYQAELNSSNQKAVVINQYLGIISPTISAVCTVLITAIGIYLVSQQQFTIGAVTAFLGYLTSFTSPANKLISAGQSIQEMESDILRVEDVMKYPDAPVFSAVSLKEGEKAVRLSGAVELDNVTFGYSRLTEPLIKNFTLSISAGQKIAIVGGSGCGKSTLAKLISGINIPWSGSIIFDGKTIMQIDRDVFTSCVSVVDQNIVLFDDTIENNIKMWDKTIDDKDMYVAANIAHIHEDIMQKEGGYRHKLLENGTDFSGGQRQRLELARALVHNPSILIMDEATSALDAKTEKDVIDAVSSKGITCIIVAHRLSTVRDCDKIIVIENGVAVESGTHDELMKLDGIYKTLVSSE